MPRAILWKYQETGTPARNTLVDSRALLFAMIWIPSQGKGTTALASLELALSVLVLSTARAT